MVDIAKRFDVQGAKAAGFTDAEIAKALAKQANFDIAGAREAGFDDANIIQTITTGEPFRETTQLGAFGAGLSRGAIDLVSTIAGAPVDIATFGIEKAGQLISPEFEIPKPFGGAESIRGAFTAGSEAIGAPIQRLEEIRPQFRPAGIAGEVGGGAAIPIGAPFAVAKGIGALKPIVKFAQEAPKRFLAAELASTAGAATGGAAAEFIDPGDPTTRFLSEVGGGIFNPTAVALKTGSKAVNSVDNLIKSFSKSGRQSKAAEVIQDIISESGENVDDIVALLNKADIAGPLTSAQKTGSPALLAIESSLAKRSGKFAGEAEELVATSFKTLRELTDNLTRSGDPAALRTAAKLRATYFDDLLGKRLEDAGQQALETRAAIGTETRADLANISIKARASLTDALQDARKIETSLWEKIPKEIRIETDGLFNSVDKVRQKLLPSENLPTLVQDELRRMLDEGTNVGEILRFRSRLLAMGRTAKSQGDFDLKNTLDTLSDGILQDLDRLPGDIAEEARTFSRILHEKFTSTFAGSALSTNVRSTERIAPEILLERAFGGGGTQAELRFRQLGEAADFPNQIFGQPMLSTQEQFLRVAAKNTIDTGTGRINPNKLQDFINNNQVTLNRFPELKKTLADATTAEAAFRDVEQATQRATKAIQQRSAFANLIKTDDPVVAVSEILTKKNAQRNYKQIAKLAQRSGPGAVSGLKSSTLQSIFNKATNNIGDFSFRRLDRILKNGLSGEKQGVLSLMTRNGIIDSATGKRLKLIVKRAIDIEDALNNQKKLDKLLENPDALFDLVTRIVGAKIGSAGVAGGAAGASLIAASAGSRFARNFAQKIPATKVNEVLEQAARDPKFMALLLKKTKSVRQRTDIERQINAFLISAGLQLDER